MHCGTQFGLTTGTGLRFFYSANVQDGSGIYPASDVYLVVIEDPSPVIKWPRRESNHLHPVPKSKMRGAVHPLLNIYS
jgi:hypothetical protein